MNVLIIDGHLLFREGLKLLLSRLNPGGMTIEACTVTEGLVQVRQHTDIGLVLLDLELPGSQGLDALARLRDERRQLPIVALSAQEDLPSVLKALALGAMAFVPKTTSPEVLFAALEAVLNGGVRTPRPGKAMQRLSDLGLTERQTQVFRLVAQGQSNKAIANSLNIAESTIKQHVKPVLKALGVTSRLGAILEVVRRGLQLEP